MEAVSSMEVVRGVAVEIGVEGEVIESSVEEVVEGVEEGGVQHKVVTANLERMKGFSYTCIM